MNSIDKREGRALVTARTVTGVVLFSVIISGCATSRSTDPRKDNIFTAAECALTKNCENFTKDQERDLAAERDEARRLEAESVNANRELADSQAEVAALQRSLDELDGSIAALRKQADGAATQSKQKKEELRKVEKELATLQDEAQSIEDDVLKEDLAVKDAEAKKSRLVNRRNELENLLLSILESE